MSGPKQSDYDKQSRITDSQLSIANENQAAATADRKRRDDLTKPAIDFNSAAIKDPKSLTTAIAPIISNITDSAKKGKESIYESMSPGQGRELALSNVDRGVRDSTASAKSNVFLQAFDKLANIGSGIGSFSLQETGASLNANQGAAQTNDMVIKDKAAQKASTMGFLGSLAGAGGAAVSGRFLK